MQSCGKSVNSLGVMDSNVLKAYPVMVLQAEGEQSEVISALSDIGSLCEIAHVYVHNDNRELCADRPFACKLLRYTVGIWQEDVAPQSPA